MLNPQRLVILNAVVSAGSVNAAARNLNYSSATISQHLAALARETGLTLFEKSGRGIVPTEAALHLAEQADELLTGFDRLERTVADLREDPAQQLAIACFLSAAQVWIPEVVKEIRKAYPSLTVEISLNGAAGGGGGHGRRVPNLDIRVEPADGPELQLDGYRRYELVTEDFLAVFPAQHPLAAVPEVTLGQLRREPWVDHDLYESPTGQIIAGACSAAGFRPRYAARLDDHPAALSLVAAGIGVAVVPRLALTTPPAGIVIKPVTNPTPRRRITVHVRHGRRGPGIVAAALSRLRELALRHP
jgi:DNA-binding transcriptional LysR family regulator